MARPPRLDVISLARETGCEAKSSQRLGGLVREPGRTRDTDLAPAVAERESDMIRRMDAATPGRELLELIARRMEYVKETSVGGLRVAAELATDDRGPRRADRHAGSRGRGPRVRVGCQQVLGEHEAKLRALAMRAQEVKCCRNVWRVLGREPLTNRVRAEIDAAASERHHR
jgi:hypothetical protein